MNYLFDSSVPRSTARVAALAASALILAFTPFEPHVAHAGTISGEMRVSLTIHDICTMNTEIPQPQIACSAGAPYRVYKDDFFAVSTATVAPEMLMTSTSVNRKSVEIAF